MKTQEVAYQVLVNSIKRGKLSHAYLINSNNFDGCYDFALSFIKTILCNEKYTNRDMCNSCNMCDRIDNGSYMELKIIEPINGIIKKEQLLELQEEFSNFSIEGKYKIYLIKDCDKMNKHAANSLLKFLEEPVENVVAILITNNYSNVMNTIVSRCQLINLLNEKEFNNDTTLKNVLSYLKKNENVFDDESVEKYSLLIDDVLEFINYVEENSVDTLIYIKKLWSSKILNREDFSFSMLLIGYFYYDILRYYNNINSYFFCDKHDDIINISKLNSVESILKKIELVDYVMKMVSSNLNLNLLINDFVIRLGECNE